MRINVKIKKSLLIFCIFITAVLLSSCGYDYEKAYDKTNALSSYEMEISTIVTVEAPDSLKQTVVTQNIEAYKIGDSSMRYTVKTDSSSFDESGNEDAATESEYTYCDGNYYISMPGVKYMSEIDFDSALKNITDLTNLISLPNEKMYNQVSEKNDGTMVYKYNVEGEDLSEYVLSLLQSAADSVEGASFKADDISGSAAVKGGYVTGRGFTAYYSSDEASFSVEVYTKLTNKRSKVDKPDASKYAVIE